MIARAFVLLLLAYLIGFVAFAFTLARPARDSATPTEAAVVLTGGAGRIEHAFDVLKSGKVRRLLVAGVDPVVTKSDIARRLGGQGELLACCIDLGSESVDTRSNAEEASRWLKRRHFQ
jgi:uncharacterized SAM-binding protein YcdF (DUF218 family)